MLAKGRIIFCILAAVAHGASVATSGDVALIGHDLDAGMTKSLTRSERKHTGEAELNSVIRVVAASNGDVALIGRDHDSGMTRSLTRSERKDAREAEVKSVMRVDSAGTRGSESQNALAVKYAVLGEGMICGYQFLASAASTATECADACSKLSGCAVFSYGSQTGCRVSACDAPDALDKSKPCGYFGENAKSKANQCGTHVYEGETLYIIDLPWVAIAANACCGYNFLSRSASSVSACAQQCQALYSGCDMFSYGDLGCRISACNEAGRTDDSKPCVNGQGGYAAKCESHRQNGNTLYQLKPAGQPYKLASASTCCGYNFLERSASSARACADACNALSSGCDMFSYGTLGCRISACKDPARIDDSKPCGLGKRGIAQCGTHDHAGNTLYALMVRAPGGNGKETPAEKIKGIVEKSNAFASVPLTAWFGLFASAGLCISSIDLNL